MDVRCSRCGVEYEFDEAKVKPTGVTVKCTSCGHVFKVVPPSQEESAPLLAAPNADGWMVRHRDGTVMRFKELTTLQKWIVEQKVTSRDEISRSGRSWRPLGDIAELASFFEVVAAANAARQAATTGSATAPVAPDDEPIALASAKVGDSGAHTPPPTALKRAPTVSPVPPEAEAGFYGGSLDALDDEDPVLAWRRRARRRNAAIAVVLILVAGVAGLFFLARPTFDRLAGQALSLVGIGTIRAPEPVDPAVTAAVNAAVAALPTRGNLAPHVTALDEIARAEDAPVAALSAASRLHAAVAMRAFDEARLLEKKLQEKPAETEKEPDEKPAPAPGAATGGGPSLEAVKQRASDALAKAYALASRARTAGPALVDADLAFATYQAAKGAVAEVSADLEAARRKGRGSPGVARDAVVIGALAAVVAASDDAKIVEAKATVERALGEAAGDARLEDALLVLRALAPASDEERAATRAAAERWRAAAPDDARPALILELLPAPAESAKEGDATAGAAKPDEKDAKARDEADDDGEGAGSLDYDTLMKRADRNRIRERTSAALALYKQAVDLRPQAAKPHVGMGWCYVDLDRMRQAADAFAYAITLDKDLAEAHFGLAEAQRFGGNKAAALRSYKRYLELSPSGPDAPVARNAIQTLEEE